MANFQTLELVRQVIKLEWPNKKRIFQFASSFMSSSSFHLDLRDRSGSFFGPQVKHSIDNFLRSVLANQKSIANF